MDVDLATLITEHQGDRTLQQLSRDCGGVPKAARLHQLIRVPQKTFPEPPTLQGLARGLGVPLRVVVHAAARSVGLDIEDSPNRLANLVPVDADRIPERSQDAVLSVIRAMLAREYELEESASPASRDETLQEKFRKQRGRYAAGERQDEDRRRAQ